MKLWTCRCGLLVVGGGRSPRAKPGPGTTREGEAAVGLRPPPPYSVIRQASSAAFRSGHAWSVGIALKSASRMFLGVSPSAIATAYNAARRSTACGSS